MGMEKQSLWEKTEPSPKMFSHMPTKPFYLKQAADGKFHRQLFVSQKPAIPVSCR